MCLQYDSDPEQRLNDKTHFVQISLMYTARRTLKAALSVHNSRLDRLWFLDN